MRKWQVLSLLVIVALSGVTIPASAQHRGASIKVVNNSEWEIHHLYLSPTGDRHWGPDQLGDNIIEANGGSYTLTNIRCAHYDIRIVDEDGDECVVQDVEMCRDRTIWRITDKILLACENDSDSDSD